MKIAFHGGKCCGIRHIHNMGHNPKSMLGELKYDPDMDIGDPDQCGEDVSSRINMFNNDAPAENRLDRLDRYLKFLDGVRPNGVIEIVLADDPDDVEDKQTELWEPVLLERGFVMVTSCYNSNSGNYIYIYHRKKDK